MARFSFSSILLLVCAALGALTLVGCGPGGPKTNPVTGKVTVDGQAVKNCMITFQPVDSANQVASGQIADDGTYTLRTGVTGTPGAMAGKYKVVLTPQMAPVVEGEDPAYMKSGTDPTKDPALQKSDVVPQEYTNVATTPKEVEVTSGDNTINIEIQSGASAASE
jgi:hypothetical protein